MTRAIDLLRTRGVYLVLLAVIPLVQVFVYAFNPGVPVFKGHSIGVVAFYATLGLAFLAWLPFRSRTYPSGLTRAFLLVALATWLYSVVRIQLDQWVFEIVAFGVPVALLMILVKPPSRRDAADALRAVAWTLVVVCVASAVLLHFDLITDGTPNTSDFEGRLSIGGLTFARWSGVFGNPNYLSPLAAFLVVYGVTLRGWQRWTLAGAGVVLLVASQGRGSMMAMFAALLVIVLWSEPVRRSAHRVAIRWVSAAGAVVFGAAYIAVIDPTLNGRVPWWIDFLQMWQTQPVFGVGTAAIIAHQDARVAAGLGGYSHCHNIVIDALTRFGIVGAVGVVALLVLAVVVTVRYLKVSALPLALVVLTVVIGMTEMVIRPHYWTDFLVILTLAALLAGSGGLPVGASVTDRDDQKVPA